MVAGRHVLTGLGVLVCAVGGGFGGATRGEGRGTAGSGQCRLVSGEALVAGLVDGVGAQPAG